MRHQPDVPPDVAWPPPFDCTGALAGAWRLLEFEEFEFGELEEFVPELEFEAGLDVPLLDVPLPDDDVPVLVLAGELPGLLVVCAEPGRTAATAPAASTLAKPTVAVAVFSLRLPRSRSATARDTWRSPSRVRGDPLSWSRLSILAVCHA
jgi:hypothetical protein